MGAEYAESPAHMSLKLYRHIFEARCMVNEVIHQIDRCELEVSWIT